MKHRSRNIAKWFLLFLLLSSVGIALNSCSCGCGSADAADVPLNVLNKANDFIISKTGKDFFDKYITPDFALITYTEPNYKMVYRLFMPEKPFVNITIKFTIDSTGKIIDGDGVTGIPDFKNDPQSCEFNIDEKTAEKIASENGLRKGVINWKTGLLWDKDLDRYVWHVLSTFSETGKGNDYKGSGKELIIDPTNGKVLSASLWHIP